MDNFNRILRKSTLYCWLAHRKDLLGKIYEVRTSSEIKRIAREIFSPIANLNSPNRASSLGSDLIVHLMLNRLDLNTRREWERHLGDSVDPPTMEPLQAFLRSQTLTLEGIEAGTRLPQTVTLRHSHLIKNLVSQSTIMLIRLILIKCRLRTRKAIRKGNVCYVMNLIT